MGAGSATGRLQGAWGALRDEVWVRGLRDRSCGRLGLFAFVRVGLPPARLAMPAPVLISAPLGSWDPAPGSQLFPSAPFLMGEDSGHPFASDSFSILFVPEGAKERCPHLAGYGPAEVCRLPQM